MEEEEMVRKRAANRTALEAIGGPKKKRKLDEALEQLQNQQVMFTFILIVRLYRLIGQVMVSGNFLKY